MSELQVVVFSLNNQMCGADTSQVHEIIRYQDVTRVPRLPKFVDGLISLRGRVVPVINLNKRFELGETEITKKTKIVITLKNDNYVGFIVNDVYEIVRFSDNETELPPESIFSAGNVYIRSIGKKDNMLISILDLGKILNESEIKRLKIKEKNG